MNRVRREVRPFIAAVVLIFATLAGALWLAGWTWIGLVCLCVIPTGVLIGYLLFFFRDPERTPPDDADAVLAAADGVVAAVIKVSEPKYMQGACIRISIFLSLFDVHVNRAPFRGTSTFLGYFPGKRLFTFQPKSSDVNQHNKILITGAKIRCLICQIVGPVCRRVVYWPSHDRAVDLAAGERIGMMKFGSRLDMYLPVGDVTVVVKPGDVVRAGESVVARVNAGT